jgi:hypothetical protein
MARTESQCITSSKKAVKQADGGQLQVCADVAEAIPPGRKGVDEKVGEKMSRYADGVGVDVKTLETYRGVGIYYGRVMEFPPTGGFSTVSYLAYRALKARCKDPADALAILKSAVDGGPPPSKSGRWTKDAILDLAPAREPQKKAKGATVDQTPAETLLAEVASKKRGKASDAEGDGDAGDRPSTESDSPAERIVAHLQAAHDELPLIKADLDAERFEELQSHVSDALDLANEALAGRVGGTGA